jgi:GntR family transcriptional regulator
MTTTFTLSQRDSRPMYLQIIEQIRIRIASGTWEAGYRLPSIRELAADTRVSVITVKRAYQELESDGVIVTRPGMGSFVADTEGLDTRLKEEEMDQHLKAAIHAARSMGLEGQALLQRLRELLGRESDDDRSGEPQ